MVFLLYPVNNTLLIKHEIMEVKEYALTVDLLKCTCCSSIGFEFALQLLELNTSS
uniref:Uncharacterized protein n=1 Tax=Rhizophora mucronata TaxID=61149 RepID=A0A2P2QI07_RHIMU